MRIEKLIKGAMLFAVLFCPAAVPAAFGQKRNAPPQPVAAKPAQKKQAAAAVVPPSPQRTKEIAPTEWQAIIGALDKEDWTQAERLAALSLGKLTADNDKKQLAQLRYFYLYALAGKAASGKTPYSELEKIAAGFVGKEFLMPSRALLSACKGNINYICPVKDDEKALRVTATNRAGSAIHSFEYVRLAEKFDFADKDKRSAFVGGTLQKAEINLYKSNIPIMRLIFERGFVNIVSSR